VSPRRVLVKLDLAIDQFPSGKRDFAVDIRNLWNPDVLMTVEAMLKNTITLQNPILVVRIVLTS
jgi:hypothetical protein